MNKNKKKVSFIIAIVMLVAYYLLTDPDLGIISNLPFGADLVIVMNIFVISAVAIVIVEVAPSLLFNGGGKDMSEKYLIDKSIVNSDGASTIYLANSIRIVGYSIIVAASIIGFSS